MGTLPDHFTYVPNTTFLNQPVAEGWLPNIPETQGRYFDNHGTTYTLHSMECHLIGGSATTGLARIGVRNITTDLDESPSSFTSSSPLPGATSSPLSPSKFLRNGHIVILRNAHTYDLLGRPL